MEISTQSGVPTIPPSLIEGMLKETLKDTSTGMTTRHVVAWVLFGLIGMAAFGYGRKQMNMKAMVIGAVLMGYPYLVSDLVALWTIGAGLTFYLLFFRD